MTATYILLRLCQRGVPLTLRVDIGGRKVTREVTHILPCSFTTELPPRNREENVGVAQCIALHTGTSRGK